MITARAIIIVTVITITLWIGIETYSTLTKATRKIAVKQELLLELEKGRNEEVLDNLGNRITY